MRMMMFVPPQSWPKRDEVDDMYEDEDDITIMRMVRLMTMTTIMIRMMFFT